MDDDLGTITTPAPVSETERAMILEVNEVSSEPKEIMLADWIGEEVFIDPELGYTPRGSEWGNGPDFEGSEFLVNIRARTRELAADIEDVEYRHIQPDRRDAVRRLLERLFDAICDLTEYEPHELEPNEIIFEEDMAILKAWNEFLDPIRALSSWTSIPNGPFLAARMTLFLMMALACQKALPLDLPLSGLSRDRVKLQINFSLKVDDTLLAFLSTIWKDSGNKEYFRWAMTHLQNDNHHIRTDYNKAAMLAISPSELWQVPGMTGKQYWLPQKGDEPIYKAFDISTATTFGEPDSVGGKQPVIEQTLYSDGPIRWNLTYCLFKDETEVWLRGPRGYRSLQFILDARQIMYPWLVGERKRLAQKAMDERLPLELQQLVISHLEKPATHPYLSHLNLSSLYRPFLSMPGNCRPACGLPTKSNPIEQTTCPSRTVYIWNLPLRAFHSFHRDTEGFLYLCSNPGICESHHEGESWKITDEEGLRSQLQQTVTSRCGPSSSLDSVGLGPFGGMEGPHDRDGIRAWLEVPAYGMEDSDLEADQVMTSAMGLVNHMVHFRSWRPIFNGGVKLRGASREKAAWSWAWSEEDDDEAKSALKDLHEWCEWCQQ
ncbi:hypothetical protein B0J13DRAFT_546766 [Dactylonectria estremocensis]|uniref:Uncharacterized protein n=1 Tax=Dactylonectria estremocensis TaxID=1079267 RepID=A0A9P9EZJ7_9HYPO|nr:hypothetical protein B0J13DRAFT_546766 [Dactylonectria estremocensis]